jgi:hypothetical protein
MREGVVAREHRLETEADACAFASREGDEELSDPLDALTHRLVVPSSSGRYEEKERRLRDDLRGLDPVRGIISIRIAMLGQCAHCPPGRLESIAQAAHQSRLVPSIA